MFRQQDKSAAKRIIIAALCVAAPAWATQQPLFQRTDLGTLGGESSQAFAINNHGEAVGMSNVALDNEHHPFLWSPVDRIGFPPGMYDLGIPWWANFGAAWDVNDNAEVVGWNWATLDGPNAPFLYSPVNKDGEIWIGAGWNSVPMDPACAVVTNDVRYNQMLWIAG